MPAVVDFETIPQLYHNLAQHYANSDHTVLAYKPQPESSYKQISWREFREEVNALSAFLLKEDFRKGDRVAILSENRYEWAVIDMAIQQLGGINVALYPTLPGDQCEYIINDSGAHLIFVSTNFQLKKALNIYDNCPQLGRIIAIEQPRQEVLEANNHVALYDQLRDEGRNILDDSSTQINEHRKSVLSDDLSTLIYTSGTTGKPKGVMLTHGNLVSNIKAAHQVMRINENDRALSFLPLCHAFERMAGYYAILAGGAEIYYAESVDTVSKNLVEAKPTIVISVPRLFEKIYNLIHKNIDDSSSFKQSLFFWAVRTGRKYARGKRGMISVGKIIADKLVFDKLKERTGGRVRLFISGGAALQREVGEFFQAAGMSITEGYGLTETSPVMSVNPAGKEQFGTVGHVLPGVTVGIQDLETNNIIAEVRGEDYPTRLNSASGEIICKGPNVMKGYWNNEEETRKIIDQNGWLHTGDIGRFQYGYLQITDRLKHMIVNAGGKNIYPGPIEDQLKTSLWIDQVIIVGEQKNYMAALIVPDFEMLKSWAEKNNYPFNNEFELIENEQINRIIGDEVKAVSKRLPSHEKVRKFKLLPEPFSIESGELTPTLKVKRRVIEERYRDHIDKLFVEA